MDKVTIVFETTTEWDSLSNETTEYKNVFGIYISEELAKKAISTQVDSLAKNFPDIKGQYSYSTETFDVVKN